MPSLGMKAIDVAAYTGATLSLYGYLSLNFMNFGSVPVVGSLDATFGLLYLRTLNLLFPYQNWDFGLVAGVYLGAFLACFVVLNRRLRLTENLHAVFALTSAVVLLTEIGICLSQPWFLNVYVISAQAGTSLSWFTNFDLIVAAASCLIIAWMPASILSRVKQEALPHIIAR